MSSFWYCDMPIFLGSNSSSNPSPCFTFGGSPPPCLLLGRFSPISTKMKCNASHQTPNPTTTQIPKPPEPLTNKLPRPRCSTLTYLSSYHNQIVRQWHRTFLCLSVESRARRRDTHIGSDNVSGPTSTSQAWAHNIPEERHIKVSISSPRVRPWRSNWKVCIWLFLLLIFICKVYYQQISRWRTTSFRWHWSFA